MTEFINNLVWVWCLRKMGLPNNAFLGMSSILKQGRTFGDFIYLLFWYFQTGSCYVTQAGPSPLCVAQSVSTSQVAGSQVSAAVSVSYCSFQLKKLGSFVQANPVSSILASD